MAFKIAVGHYQSVSSVAAFTHKTLLVNNVLVFLFSRSDFCLQNPQFSSGSFSVSVSDSRAAFQMLQSKR